MTSSLKPPSLTFLKRSSLAVTAMGLLAACSGDDAAVPEAPLPELFAFEDDGLFPEGTAYAPNENAFFAGSLGHGGVTRLNADGSQELIYTAPSGWVTLGMKISPTSGELVMCAIEAVGTPDVRSAIWSFDPASGERLRAVSLDPAFATAVCNDVAFDASGMVYVTDRENPNLYRVDLQAETASLFLTDPALAPEVIGCNGIVVTDGLLLVGKYSSPTILRIPIDAPDTLAPVTLAGDELGSLPDGFDGMVLQDGQLMIAGNSQVYRLTGDASWTTAAVTAFTPEIKVAALTIANGRVYGLKGEIVAFVLGGAPDLPFQLKALDL